MAYLESSMFAWTLGILQIAGLISAWLARLRSAGSWLVRAKTMLSVTLGPRCWITTCTTLSVMVLGAIWDFRPAAGASSL